MRGSGSDSSPSTIGAGGFFHLLLDGKPRTRAQLAKSTGLARSTIATRVDDLMRMGLISPVAEAASTGGRPPALFALNPSARVVFAFDIGASHATVAVMNLAAEVLAERTEALDIALGPHTVLTRVLDIAFELLGETGHDQSDVVAIGIGVPGPVEFSTGRPVNPPIMPGWDKFDVPQSIRERIDVPVLVDNDVNIMALGERAIAWPDTDHLIFVKVATGIGLGVISGGQLIRGAQGVAGDIGHVRLSRGGDVPCSCGNMGCLEALAAGPAIARDLRASGIEVSNASEVVDLVKRGNLDAIQAVRQAGRDIGEVLMTCVSLMNPEVIAIGGSMARVGEHIIAGVREIVYTRSIPIATERLSIVLSTAADRAGVLGAGMLAIDHALSPDGLQELVQ